MFVKKANLNPAFQHNEYMFRSKFKLFGRDFKVFDGNENLVFYSEQKAFKLKEDFRIYSDESKTTELLSLKSDRIIDIGTKYNIHDSTTDEVVGSIKRKILTLKDEWTFFSDSVQEIGKITKSSITWAMIRKMFFFPQYIISDSNGEKIAEIKQQWSTTTLFGLEYKMNIIERNPSIDKRLLISMGILLIGTQYQQQGYSVGI